MKYSVLIVEDDPMARQLFELFVEQSEQYEVVESIENAEMADIYCVGNKIDLIVMDICTANYASGLKAAKRIKQKYPAIKILMVTSMPDETYLSEAKEIGVEGFWYKDIRKEPFYHMLDAIMKGDKVLPSSAPKLQLGLASSDEFTSREMEVLRELTYGNPDAIIADNLNMSIPTVKIHIQHLREKTGYRNRTELAVRAKESGIVG